MKKLASLLVAAVLLVVAMVPAFAANKGINQYEKKLTQYMKTAYVVDGKTITATPEYFTALENIFMEVDVTEAQYNEIQAILDEALTYVKAKKLVKIEDISATNSTQDLLDFAERALNVLGYHVTTEGHLSDADHGKLIITDGTGRVVAELHPAIVKTGADYSSAAVLGLASVAVLAAAGVCVKRFGKDSDAE